MWPEACLCSRPRCLRECDVLSPTAQPPAAQCDDEAYVTAGLCSANDHFTAADEENALPTLPGGLPVDAADKLRKQSNQHSQDLCEPPHLCLACGGLGCGCCRLDPARLAGRGISLQQLTDLFGELCQKRQIVQDVKTWRIVRDVIIPETAEETCAFMDSLFMFQRGGPKPPAKLISHSWGSEVRDLLLTAAQDASGLGPSRVTEAMTSGTLSSALVDGPASGALTEAYWLCFLAVNQHRTICGTDMNPCSCGSIRYPPGHPLCEADKFDKVVEQMPRGLVVSLDPNLATLSRIWCLDEISTAMHKQLPMSFVLSRPMSKEVEGRLASGQAAQPVQDCQASFQSDKDRILQKIKSTVGFERFDKEIKVLLHMQGPQMNGLTYWKKLQKPAPWQELTDQFFQLPEEDRRQWQLREAAAFDRTRFLAALDNPRRFEFMQTRVHGPQAGMQQLMIGIPISWECVKLKYNKPGAIQEQEFQGDLPEGYAMYENVLAGSKCFFVSHDGQIGYNDFGKWCPYKKATALYMSPEDVSMTSPMELARP